MNTLGHRELMTLDQGLPALDLASEPPLLSWCRWPQCWPQRCRPALGSQPHRTASEIGGLPGGCVEVLGIHITEGELPFSSWEIPLGSGRGCSISERGREMTGQSAQCSPSHVVMESTVTTWAVLTRAGTWVRTGNPSSSMNSSIFFF